MRDAKENCGENGPANLKKRACRPQDFWPPIVSSQFPKCSRMDNAEDNIDEKMILYFNLESRGALKSLTLFITVQTITKLILERSEE